MLCWLLHKTPPAGCFCNPGACTHYLGLTSSDLLSQHAAGHVCWDDLDLIDGRPNGAVRASFGYSSSYADVAVLLEFLQRFFVNNSGSSVSSTAGCAAAAEQAEADSDAQARVTALAAPGKAAAAAGQADSASSGSSKASLQLSSGSALAVRGTKTSIITTTSSSGRSNGGHHAQGAISGRLAALYLYPVKSCAPQQVPAWPIGPNGLLYDREWAVCGPDGQLLSQKRVPRLTQVRAEVDLQQQVLRLTAPGLGQQLLVPLLQHSEAAQPGLCAGAEVVGAQSRAPGVLQQQQQEVRVCGDRVCAQVLAGQVLGVAACPSEPSVQTAAAVCTSTSITSSSKALQGGACAAAGPAAALDEAAVQQWFTAAVGIPCRLVRQLHASRRVKQQQQQQQDGVQGRLANGHGTPADRQGQAQTLGFANESQYLLVNQASVDYMAAKLSTAGTAAAGATDPPADSAVSRLSSCTPVAELDALRFRPNLVVSGFEPWAEDAWRGVVVQPAQSGASLSKTSAVHAAERSSSGPACSLLGMKQQQQQQQERQTCVPTAAVPAAARQ